MPSTSTTSCNCFARVGKKIHSQRITKHSLGKAISCLRAAEHDCLWFLLGGALLALHLKKALLKNTFSPQLKQWGFMMQ